MLAISREAALALPEQIRKNMSEHADANREQASLLQDLRRDWGGVAGRASSYNAGSRKEPACPA
ncbi:hypothetical protein EMIT0324P_40291 [Pseudomonas chlororaphis]